jgi:malonate decarboxylase acyl carrier protein
MALRELKFSFSPESPKPFPLDGTHRGVVGSGDMEVMFTKADLGGKVEFAVCTPVNGFDDVWEKVLERFVNESNIADCTIEINDNNATPVVVSMRLRQALQEALKEVE